MFGFPRQSRDSCTTRLFLLAQGADKSPLCCEVQNPSIIVGASLCFMGDRQEWKGHSFFTKNMYKSFYNKKTCFTQYDAKYFFQFFLRK